MNNQFNLLDVARSVNQHFTAQSVKQHFNPPVFIVASPRSGSSLLFEQLAKVEGFWSIGGESHIIFRAFAHLRAQNAALDSGCLDEQHADDQTAELIRASFLYLARNPQGRQYLDPSLIDKPSSITLLEKTPRNALNIPFLLKIFPTAKFIYLHRDPRENIASLIEAWQTGLTTGRFITYKNLPGWDRNGWCFLLPPGWRELKGKSLAHIATFQWFKSNQIMLEQLTQIPPSRCMVTSYQALTENPSDTLTKLLQFANIPVPDTFSLNELSLSKTTLTAPHPDKWRQHETDILPLLPQLQPLINDINQFNQSHGLA